MYESLKIGDPFDRNIQVGPLISEQSYEAMKKTIDDCSNKAKKIHGGQKLDIEGGTYVQPAIVEVDSHIDEMKDVICKMIKCGYMFSMDRDRVRDAIEDFTFMCQPDDDLNKDRIFKSLEYEDEEDSDEEMDPSFAHGCPPCAPEQDSGPTCEEISESA